MRTVTATRYVAPLREGGSMPGLVEADDDGLYVLKFRGAGQGPLALVAEVVGGELARALGLLMPELVLIDLDPVLGHAEPDPEIQELIDASAGVNLGVDFLPGALPFAAAIDGVDPGWAADVVWLDALITNVDRTPRNPNLLSWHGRVWLIDHGAALYRQHAADDLATEAGRPFAPIRDHVLLPHAGSIADAHERLAPKLDAAAVDAVVGAIPQAWLSGRPRARPRRPALAREAFQYAVLQVVPRVERGERINAGVVLFSRRHRFLAARVGLDRARLAALDPETDAEQVERHLEALARVAAGDPQAGAVAAMEPSERFHWLAAPSSTIIQPSPVHTGLCDDPEAMLEHLFETLVA